MKDRRLFQKWDISRYDDSECTQRSILTGTNETVVIEHKPSARSPFTHTTTKKTLQKRFRWSEFLAETIIALVAFLSFAIIILIFVFVFREAIPIVVPAVDTTAVVREEEQLETYGDEHVSELLLESLSRENKQFPEISGSEGVASLSNLLGKQWQPVSAEPKYGLLPLITGSAKVSFVAVLIAAPIAIFSALYTSAFAPRWAKEILKPSIEILAGMPSVVIGFFALTVMATFFQSIFGYQYRLNAFVAGVALSLAVIPIIFTIAEDALTTVPRVLSEASLALGATQWQTALFVVLPAATPGIFAAVLLGVGRAFGETMIVLMATGNAALFSAKLFEPVRTMSATIGAEMAEVVFGDTHYTVLFLVGSLLFVVTFSLNATAEIFIRRRLLKRFRGT